jgi:uncharacterized membrane protein YqjE
MRQRQVASTVSHPIDFRTRSKQPEFSPLYESRMSLKMDAEKSNAQQPMGYRPVASWASTVVDYFDLKARLLAVESKEAFNQFVGLLILVVVLLVLAVSSVLMYGAFLLYFVSLLLHLNWGWSALISAVILTLACVLALLILRVRLRKPVFQMTLKDLGKDKEWLSQSKTKAY